MKSKLWLLMSVTILTNLSAQITGDLVLKPDGCEKTSWCLCINPLTFKDPHQIVWKTKDSLKTDGASIPPIFQPIVGKPFDHSYLKAAIIHDHYCDRHVRPWRQTHRVFYDALISENVPKLKSKLMYYAVYWGGPKWVELIPGIGCGEKCVQRLPNKVAMDLEKTHPEWEFARFKGAGFKVRPANYESPQLKKEMDELSAILAKNPDSLDVEDLEKRAKEKNPNDFYFNHPDIVFVSESDLDGVLQAR